MSTRVDSNSHVLPWLVGVLRTLSRSSGFAALVVGTCVAQMLHSPSDGSALGLRQSLFCMGLFHLLPHPG